MSGWACKCPGGFNLRGPNETGCGRCGAVNPTLPRGFELMRYQRQLALEQQDEAAQRAKERAT